MAKLTTVITGDSMVSTLEFKGKTFTNTWVPCDCGSKTLEKAFETQVLDAFPKLDADIFSLIEDLSTEDNDEIQRILLELEYYEKN